MYRAIKVIIKEGEVRVCGDAVLRYFWCVFAEIRILACSNAVFFSRQSRFRFYKFGKFQYFSVFPCGFAVFRLTLHKGDNEMNISHAKTVVSPPFSNYSFLLVKRYFNVFFYLLSNTIIDSLLFTFSVYS